MAHPPTTSPRVIGAGAPPGPAGPTEQDVVPTGFTLPTSVFESWAGFTTALTQGLPHGVERAARAARAFQQAVK